MADVRCNRCGKIYDDSKKSCPNCYSTDRETIHEPSSEAVAMADRFYDREKKKYIKIAVAAGVLVVGIIIFAIFGPDSKTPSSSSKTETKTTTKARTQESSIDESIAPEDQELTDIYVKVKHNYESAAQEITYTLYDQSSNPIITDGSAKITIMNSLDEQVYYKDIPVKMSDFDEYGYATIVIPDADIEETKSTNGHLSFTFSSGVRHNITKNEIDVYNLPEKQTTIKVHSTPITITNRSYSGYYDKKIRINKLEVYEGSYSTIKVKMEITMIANGQGNNSNDYTNIVYKFKDSKGTILDSGTFLVSRMSVGDTINEEFTIYGVEIIQGDDYKLELFDD